MLGAGTGLEIRRPLGFAIAGGLVVSQFLTLYTTPAVYLYSTAPQALRGAPEAAPSRAQALFMRARRDPSCASSLIFARRGPDLGPVVLRSQWPEAAGSPRLASGGCRR